MNWLLLALITLGAYLIGAIPTAYLLCARKGIDIFEIGSGNMGATNVARALGFRAGVLTWIIDIVKGMIPVGIAQLLFVDDPLLGGVVAGLAALFGHSWSIWVLLLTGKLRGGKSASTTLGTWLVLAPWYMTLGCLAVFGSFLYFTRIVSLSVLVTIGLGAAWLLFLVAQGVLAPLMGVYAVVVFILIFFKHRENIQRMIQGNERRFGKSE